MHTENRVVQLDALTPHDRNYNRHPPGQVRKLAKSLTKFGQVRSIVVWRSTVLAGHGVVEAARSLGWKELRADVLPDDYPDHLALAYVAADNELARQGDPDMVQLAAILEESLATDAELLEAIGYSDAEYADLLKQVGVDALPADLVDVEPQVDRAEELRQKWGVESGQMWQLGDHRLICGDCTDAAVVARVMQRERAQAVVTDPPYGQNQNGVTNDAPELLQGIVTGAIANLPIDNAVVLAFSSPRTFPVWLDAARANGHKFERMLWMYKAAQETFPWRGWLLKSEAILATSVGDGQWQDVHPYSHDCYYKSEVSGQLPPDSGWHGSVKPMDVVTDLVKRVSPAGAIVYEPFSGSGTTIMACEALGRKCRAVEISPGYVAVALERWSTATGKTPILLELVHDG